MSIYTVGYDQDLYQGDLVCLEFLNALKTQEGDLTLGDDSAVGSFYARTDRTISGMMSDAQAFWTTGVANSGSSTAISGLSATTPREYFDCWKNGGGGTGSWQYDSTDASGSYVTGLNFALALRGLYTVGGYTSQVESVWSWLDGLTSNAAFESADVGQQAISQALTGEFDPAMATTTKVRVLTGAGAAAADNGSALYEWSTVGVLADLRSDRDRYDFTQAKRAMSKMRRMAYRGFDAQVHFWPFLRGRTGLTFQVSFTETVEGASRRVFDVVAAARCGLAYREQPKIYGLQG